MILYPTETIYALGVNALDEAEIAKLFQLKGRAEGKSVSWLVRDVGDIERYAELGEVAAKIATRFLPGPLTLVLPTKPSVDRTLVAPDGSIGFRISPDPVAQSVIAEFMSAHDAPLTCTSANVSGLPTAASVSEILHQFKTAGKDISTVNRTIDDGPRSGVPSTVVRVMDDRIEILREGAIPEGGILSAM